MHNPMHQRHIRRSNFGFIILVVMDGIIHKGKFFKSRFTSLTTVVHHSTKLENDNNMIMPAPYLALLVCILAMLSITLFILLKEAQ
ncbi:MAG: hypothetical protein A4E44_01401 [Methanosaeta sp. PtaB.Bin018]|nr:MAG: hypothetical protein A4E44_01401 [Methanosaeta sp. PtaB.Bin018]OPY46658.1 MAG: hypothetical protein A4E46_00828 [Methanosaeta sp. PtaU1.Bin016]